MEQRSQELHLGGDSVSPSVATSSSHGSRMATGRKDGQQTGDVIPRVVHLRRRRGDKFAFGRGDTARPLRIYVDGETVPDSPEVEVLMGSRTTPRSR